MRMMHSFLLGLALLALANMAVAGPAAPTPGPLPSGPIVTTVDPALVSGSVVSPAAPGAACCGVKTKHVCVPEVAPKTITHVRYSVKCVHICLPSCSAFGGKCDKGCGQGECGKAREVRR